MAMKFFHSFTLKQIVAVITATVPMVCLMTMLMWLSISRNFESYIQSVALAGVKSAVGPLQEVYAASGNWDQVPRNGSAFHDWLQGRMPRQAGTASPSSQGGDPARPPPDDRIRIDRRLALLDADGEVIVGPPGRISRLARLPVLYQGSVVGYATLVGADVGALDSVPTFPAGQTWSLLLVGMLTLALAAACGWLMARHFLRPVRDLAAATRQMAEGAYDCRLPEDRNDEFGELVQALRQLAVTLREHEFSRRKWVANTSHELRTPISVLRAQIEAMQDGIHRADPKTLGVLHGEVMGLSRLVDDLYTLARADVGELKVEMLPVEPVAILDDVADAFLPRFSAAGLTLEVTGHPDRPWISLGDQTHLARLFTNIIENSARYTDAGGKLSVHILAKANTLVLRFDDTAPGVPDDDMPHLFERFYRVENSRNRQQGGSGLGLSICRGIVEAHGGQMTATSSPLGGIRVEIVLPQREEK